MHASAQTKRRGGDARDYHEQDSTVFSRCYGCARLWRNVIRRSSLGLSGRIFSGGPDSSHYSDLKQINTGNVDKLDVAWSYLTGDEVTYTFSPLVIDNIAYFAAKQGSLVAVDASTGKELWTHSFTTPGAAPSRFAGIAGQRGGNYWESKDRKDRRIFVSANGSLQAIDAQTGKLVDSFADHGKLDLEDWPRPGQPTAGIQECGSHL